jgi:hypothetical protein
MIKNFIIIFCILCVLILSVLLYKKQDEILTEINKYHIWDLEDNLKAAFDSNSKDSEFIYFNYLKLLFDNYSSIFIVSYLINKKNYGGLP